MIVQANDARGLEALRATLAPALEGRVLVLTGAGISEESGIATFRGAGGLWGKVDPMKLATPEAFAEDPAGVWRWYGERRDRVRAALPNPGHIAIAGLSRRAQAHLVATQNVDDLHERSGVALDHLVHVHGEILVTRCVSCPFATRDPVPAAPLPTCGECGSGMRPGVVWFGENLDPRQVQRVERFLSGAPCDLVLVIGTSALFGYIQEWAGSGRILVAVNSEDTPLTRFATHFVRGKAGETLPTLLG